MRHPITVLLTALAVTATIAAQESQPSSAEASVVRDFVASLPGTLPAELTADLLLRAADSERANAAGHDWLVSTYERAFELAGSSPIAVSRRMLPWGHPDTREAIVSAGYERGLDTTSLRARAALGMLRVEPRRALTLLEHIAVETPALSCGETLMYDVSAPYQALAAIVRHFHHSPFGAKDVESAARARKVLMTRLAALASSTEIAPAVSALKTANLPAVHAQPMWATLADRLHALRDDDRTFSASLSNNWMEMEQAIHALDTVDPRSAVPVLEAFRAYLVRHLSTRRCALVRANARAIVSMEAQVIDGLNDALTRHAWAPIASSERRGSHTIPSARMGELWQSPQAAYLHDTLQSLFATWSLSTADNTVSAANQRVLTEFWNGLAEWSPHDERRASDYLHHWLLLMSRLAALDVSVRPHAVRESIALLRVSAGIQPSVNWFAHLGELLERATANDDDLELRLLSESGDPILSSYAQLITVTRAASPLP